VPSAGEAALPGIYELPLGGTAVGTGNELNPYTDYFIEQMLVENRDAKP
jgi:fumarate hydratase class II